MRYTRRAWATVLAGLALVGLGLAAARPVLLVGGALVGAWLLAAQVRFVRAVLRTADGLTVEQRPQRDRVVAGQAVAVSMYAGREDETALGVRVESRPPPGTQVHEEHWRTVTLEPGESRGLSTYHASWPHAGRLAFSSPAVTFEDAGGLFEASTAIGPAPVVTIEPRVPRDLHVGVGGERVASAYGQHRTGARGSGLDPAELRPYLPGDDASRIDWRATARLAEPYVREFEVERDRRIVLVVDHRSPMGVGIPGERKLDYTREIGLAVLRSARSSDDPLACVSVGDHGVTGRFGFDANRRHYARIRSHLSGLEADRDAGRRRPRVGGRIPGALPVEHLADESVFAETLRAFAGPVPVGTADAERDPFVDAVTMAHERLRGTVLTILLTDDTDPRSTRLAVKRARTGSNRVLVYLTPSGLFEPGGLHDLETAYDRYVEFEDLRRSLDRQDRVDALEVAPGDRLDAVLSAGRRRRRVRGGRR